jgi:hypothetical protein
MSLKQTQDSFSFSKSHRTAVFPSQKAPTSSCDKTRIKIFIRVSPILCVGEEHDLCSKCHQLKVVGVFCEGEEAFSSLFLHHVPQPFEEIESKCLGTIIISYVYRTILLLPRIRSLTSDYALKKQHFCVT